MNLFVKILEYAFKHLTNSLCFVQLNRAVTYSNIFNINKLPPPPAHSHLLKPLRSRILFPYLNIPHHNPTSTLCGCDFTYYYIAFLKVKL